VLQNFIAQLNTGKFGKVKEQEFFSLFDIKKEEHHKQQRQNILFRGLNIDACAELKSLRAARTDRPSVVENGAFDAKYGPTYPTE
jgi:DNA-binding TFAR19-related protein (PDSD5 family)